MSPGLLFRYSRRTLSRKAKRGLWSLKLEWTSYRTSMQIPWRRKNRTEGERREKRELKERKQKKENSREEGKKRVYDYTDRTWCVPIARDITKPVSSPEPGRVLCSKHFSFSYCGKIILVILLMQLKCHSSVFKLLHRRSRGLCHRLQACCGCNLPKVTIINVKLL